jgi:hypothetical protein
MARARARVGFSIQCMSCLKDLSLESNWLRTF